MACQPAESHGWACLAWQYMHPFPDHELSPPFQQKPNLGSPCCLTRLPCPCLRVCALLCSAAGKAKNLSPNEVEELIRDNVGRDMESDDPLVRLSPPCSKHESFGPPASTWPPTSSSPTSLCLPGLYWRACAAGVLACTMLTC